MSSPLVKLINVLSWFGFRESQGSIRYLSNLFCNGLVEQCFHRVKFALYKISGLFLVASAVSNAVLTLFAFKARGFQNLPCRQAFYWIQQILQLNDRVFRPEVRISDSRFAFPDQLLDPARVR